MRRAAKLSMPMSSLPSLDARVVLLDDGNWCVEVAELLSEACAPPPLHEGEFMQHLKEKRLTATIVDDKIRIYMTRKRYPK
jgi:hypothetical protein